MHVAEKYCRLLEREGGREALTRVVSSQSYRRIRELAQRTLNQLDIKDLSCSSSSGQEESSEHVAHANEGMEAEEDEEVEERMSEEEEEEEDGREEEDDFLEDEDQRPDGGELDGDLDNGFVILWLWLVGFTELILLTFNTVFFSPLPYPFLLNPILIPEMYVHKENVSEWSLLCFFIVFFFSEVMFLEGVVLDRQSSLILLHECSYVIYKHALLLHSQLILFV